MYESLYAAHDEALGQRRAAAAEAAEHNAKRRRLEEGHENLEELPALSSFISILDHWEAASSAKQLQPEKPQSMGPCTRDGFERMRRCRMALDALDQVLF